MRREATVRTPQMIEVDLDKTGGNAVRFRREYLAIDGPFLALTLGMGEADSNSEGAMSQSDALMWSRGANLRSKACSSRSDKPSPSVSASLL
jgi:hypothetical protein